jgi:predicted Zn-dependent protease
MNNLPEEVLLILCQYLPFEDLSRFCCTCQFILDALWNEKNLRHVFVREIEADILQHTRDSNKSVIRTLKDRVQRLTNNSHKAYLTDNNIYYAYKMHRYIKLVPRTETELKNALLIDKDVIDEPNEHFFNHCAEWLTRIDTLTTMFLTKHDSQN